MSKPLPDFDVVALREALDARRLELGLSWRQVMSEINSQSPGLAARLGEARHPFSQSTVTNMARRRDLTCQHALPLLFWLGRSPESFVPDGRRLADEPLPDVGPDHNLRWHIPRLYEALNQQRQARGMTWRALAAELNCSPNQLSGLPRIRYAISIRLAMRITRWLDRPAREFMFAADW
jgi:hypothetical protein